MNIIVKCVPHMCLFFLRVLEVAFVMYMIIYAVSIPRYIIVFSFVQ